MKVKGDFFVRMLEESMNVIVDWYDIFCIVFIYEKVKCLVQVVLKKRIFYIDEIDLIYFFESEQMIVINEYKEKDKVKGFQLICDILMCVVVFKKVDKCYEWVWSYYYILFDGWCFGVVV